ncbi:hypothetical protein PC116_g33282, partial [Phytophthora cactorum]
VVIDIHIVILIVCEIMPCTSQTLSPSREAKLRLLFRTIGRIGLEPSEEDLDASSSGTVSIASTSSTSSSTSAPNMPVTAGRFADEVFSRLGDRKGDPAGVVLSGGPSILSEEVPAGAWAVKYWVSRSATFVLTAGLGE